MIKYKVDILTGLRPTANLTIANYIGSVKNIIELQNSDKGVFLFIADLHGLTTHPAKELKKNIDELIVDYLSLGINFEKVNIYIQSDIEEELAILTLFLSSHISVAELLRVPTLKEKIKENMASESANSLLFFYPILMAADILIQRANKVSLGEDQLPHMEITRLLARRFNKKYGDVLHVPSALQVKPLRILALKGKGKMSKSTPSSAIFLTDTFDIVAKKIKAAETAMQGQMSKKLESHILLIKNLITSKEKQEEIDEIIKKHLNGDAVMKEFKEKMLEIIWNFLKNFQAKRKEFERSKELIDIILKQGKIKAKANASQTVLLVKKAMYG